MSVAAQTIFRRWPATLRAAPGRAQIPRYAALLAAGLAVLLTAQLLPGALAEDQDNQIRIGMFLPLNQEGEVRVADRLAAAVMALEDFNAEQSDAGTPYRATLEVIYQNGTALEGAKAAHIRDGIQYYVGPMGSSDARMVREYATDNGLVIVSPSSTAQSLAIPGDNLFRLAPADDLQSVYLSDLVGEAGKTHVVIVNKDDPWGNGLTEGFIQSYTGTVSDAHPLDGDSSSIDFGALAAQLDEQLGQLIRDHGVERVAILYLGHSLDLISLADAITADPALDSVTAVKWYGADSVATSSALAADPAAAEFVMSVGLTGIIFDVVSNPVNERIDEHLASLDPPLTPNVYAYSSYDAARLLAYSIVASIEQDRPVVEMIPEMANGEFLFMNRDILADSALGDYALNEAGDLVEPSTYHEFEIVVRDGAYVWEQILHKYYSCG